MSDAPKLPSAPQERSPWWVLPALGTLVFSLFGIALGLAFLWGNETQQTTMLTAAVTLSSGVLGYFFGSSSGSQKKDDTIAKITTPDTPVAIAVSNPAPPATQQVPVL